MPNVQSWHLMLTNDEQTRIDDVAKVSDDGATLAFENDQGETICLVNRASLVFAKRVDLSGPKR